MWFVEISYCTGITGLLFKEQVNKSFPFVEKIILWRDIIPLDGSSHLFLLNVEYKIFLYKFCKSFAMFSCCKQWTVNDVSIVYHKLHDLKSRIGSHNNRVVIIYPYNPTDIAIELHRKPFYWFTSTCSYRYCSIVQTSSSTIKSIVNKSCYLSQY